MYKKDIYIFVVVAILFAIICIFMLRGHVAVDILSPYLAAVFFEQGYSAEIYGFAASEQFSALPPETWSAAAQAKGFMGSYLTPYLYPPLWAAILAPFTTSLDIPTFVVVVYMLHIPMILASIYLCWHLFGRRGRFLFWIVPSLAIFLTSAGGLLALAENQPQILAMFLILLGFYLFQNEKPVWAGVIIAIAASLKIFPLVFVVIFLAKRKWLGLLAVVGTGAILFGLSFALAGPDLHAQFLKQMNDINTHVFVSRHNWGLNTFLFQLFSSEGGLTQSLASEVYYITDATPWIRTASVGLLASGCLIFGVMFAKEQSKPVQFQMLIAFSLLVGLCSPLGWSHNFLQLIFVAPILFYALSRRWASVLSLMIFGLQTLVVQNALAGLNPSFNLAQFFGTISVLIALLAILAGIYLQNVANAEFTSRRD